MAGAYSQNSKIKRSLEKTRDEKGSFPLNLTRWLLKAKRGGRLLNKRGEKLFKKE